MDTKGEIMSSKLAQPPSGAAPKRIFVVEDHPISREGVIRAIDEESDLTVCGHSDSAHKAFSAISRLKPDLALIDLTLPGRSGIELIKDLHAAWPEIPLLVVSMHDELLFAERALRAGARGYVMKHEDTKTVIGAIRHVLGGGVFVSPRMSDRILQNLSGGRARSVGSPIERLTDREFEVLQLIGRGLGTKEIARHLHLSAKTIAVHKTRIKRKLKLTTTTEVIRFAVTCEAPRAMETL